MSVSKRAVYLVWGYTVTVGLILQRLIGFMGQDLDTGGHRFVLLQTQTLLVPYVADVRDSMGRFFAASW